MNKKKLVIDVNVFLATFFFKSKIGEKILYTIKEEIFILLSSDEFINELKRKVNLFKKNLDKEDKFIVDEWIIFIEKISKTIKIKNRIQVCRDKNDDYLINLYIEGRASFLITRDKDLLEIDFKKNNLQNIKIITPENFLKIIY